MRQIYYTKKFQFSFGSIIIKLVILYNFYYHAEAARREHNIELTVNGRRLKKLIIDPHYEVKHSESVSDEIIIDLVKELDGGGDRVEKVDKQGFQYFVEDHLELNDKLYKLIWLLHDDEIFIGVVNCYRRN